MKPAIVYFRHDLRLSDNPALSEAAKEKVPLIPIYIFDTKYPGKWKIGGAQKWWIHHSILALQKQLKQHGACLILRKGDPLRILEEIINETKARRVFWNRCYEPSSLARDRKLQTSLRQLEVEVKTFNGSLLREPWETESKGGTYFKVFTPFWKQCVKAIDPKPPLPIPEIVSYKKDLISDTLDSWELLPSHPDWATGIRNYWTPGAIAGNKQLERFVENDLSDYKTSRDFPGADKTSHLSPYLHMGEVSPRQIWHAANQSLAKKESVDCFLSELGWREFSYHLLYHFPDLPHASFSMKFSRFQWDDNPKALEAWQKGMTGYPIVDAGMRQLWKIGWMHNRVRMIVASFLTKDLFIHWSKGEEWFWDTLVDADLANNSASWQWVAGSGADAAPYFRIFNPILQGERFDPEGVYVRKWVPELAQLPMRYIHQPWEAPNELLKSKKIRLGHDYPYPIVEHKNARKEALRRFAFVSGKSSS